MENIEPADLTAHEIQSATVAKVVSRIVGRPVRPDDDQVFTAEAVMDGLLKAFATINMVEFNTTFSDTSALLRTYADALERHGEVGPFHSVN